MLEYLNSMDEFVRKPKNILKETPKNSPTNQGAPIKYADLAAASNSSVSQPADAKSTNKSSSPQNKRFKLPSLPTPKTRAQWIITVIAIMLLLSGTGFAVYWFIFRDTTPPAPAAVPLPEPEPTPEPILSKLSGREVAESINSRSVYSVQIENSPEARPQSGLIDADIVFEAIAEGGITRFNALYHDNIPANIGPIRSLRPYFVDFFLPFDASIVHAGGSAEAINDIRTLGLKDIDHGNSPIFRRVTNRYAPHNLYSTGQQLLDLHAERGYSSKFTSLKRKKPEASETPTATAINLNISSRLYNVDFSYDKATNTYLRSQAGMEHVDADTKRRISPDVVVVPIIGRRAHPNRVHNIYDTVGSGKLYVFQDGQVVEGKWEKASRDAQWILTADSGEAIELNAGQAWFSIVESAERVSYQ